MVGEAVLTTHRAEAARTVWLTSGDDRSDTLSHAGVARLQRVRSVPEPGADAQRREPGADVPRVLVVDDDASLRELLVEILERHDRLAVAGAASDGETAIDAAARLRPDAV